MLPFLMILLLTEFKVTFKTVSQYSKIENGTDYTVLIAEVLD